MKERGTFTLCVSAGLFLLFSAATAQTSGSGLFQCPDGRYVLEEYLCDGDNDCRDGNKTDEQNCPTATATLCAEHEFMCRETSRCLLRSVICDGLEDCPSGEDEQDCGQRQCGMNQFTCTNGNCVWTSFRCDGEDDCRDGSDEVGCQVRPGCGEHQWTCASGMCVPSNWRCDEALDCDDSSDEESCGEIIHTCTFGMFNCSVGGCLNANLVCDGTSDCPDGSDEEDCPTRECNDDQFQCNNGERCIPKHWRCDAENDCDDFSDEKDCGGDCEFSCLTGGCVFENQTCDGIEDCLDGSDEYLPCFPTTPPPPLVCRDSQFLCIDGRECIAASLVCDNRTHCGDGSDETLCTHTPHACSADNGGCEQHCHDTVYDRFCTCDHGYLLDSTNRTACLDIDECAIFGTCSHYCTNFDGGYECTCDNGYQATLTGGGCKAVGPPARLLIANRIDIRFSSLDGSSKSIILRNLHSGMAVNFHYRLGYIFWSDTILDEIKRSWMNGSEITTIVDAGLDNAGGLAVDWVSDKLYWTDIEKRRLGVSDLSGQNRSVLFSNLDKPLAIALDPRSRLIFWTDLGASPSIERASMDGTDRRLVIQRYLVWPNTLAIDYPTETLVWADSNLKVIESCRYDGSNRRQLLAQTEGIGHPFGLTVFEDYIFWSDIERQGVYTVGKRVVENATEVYGNLFNPVDLHTVHPATQPPATNPCAVNNGGCSYLCLLSSSSAAGYSCACPTGIRASADGHSCQPLESFLLFARRVDIRRVSLDVPAFVDIPIAVNLSNAVALDWDSDTELMFWTDFNRDTINVANLDGTNQRVLIADNLGAPGGIALDWINRKLYWTDSNTDRIEVADLDGGNRAVIVPEGLDRPRAIVVHPMAGLMFWTDWGSRPAIERAGLDGSDRTYIATTNLTFPNALALDFVNARIYWVDARFGTMESAYLDGSDRRALLSVGLPHPYGLALHGDFLYWTDWEARAVQRVNKTDPAHREVVIRNIDTPMDIQVFHRNRATLNHHPCLDSNGGCSDLCLPRPGKQAGELERSCLCPNGRALLADNVTCRDSLNSYLLFPTLTDMRQISLDVPFYADLVLPISRVSDTASADVDLRTDEVYWTNGLDAAIYKSPIGGGPSVTVIKSGLVSPRSVSVDWIGGTLYWLDSGRRRIEVAHLNGSNRRALVYTNLVTPNGLAIDVESHAMFWTDIGVLSDDVPAKIERATMDGSGRRAIITSRIRMPRSITVDNPPESAGLGGRLYWTDSFYGIIYSSSLFGEDVRAVLGGLASPYGLAIHGDLVFWTDWNLQTLNSADKTTGSDQKVVTTRLPGLQEVRHIRKADLSIASSFNHPCEESHGCSDLCLPNQSFRKFTCACQTGVQLGSDGRTCRKIPKSYLLFSTFRSINRISLDTSEFVDVVVADGLKNTITLDYRKTNEDEGRMFWTDIYKGGIYSANLNGTDHTEVVRKIGRPEGLAVDWMAYNIYWVSSKHRKIEVARLDGRHRRTVIDSDLLAPRSIAVHPLRSLLFWTDWATHRIERSKLDGSERHRLITSTIVWPNEITVDFEQDLIYWVDAHRDVVEVATLNGGGRRVVVDNMRFNLNHPFGLSVLGDHVFWSDWRNWTIVRADTDGGNQEVVGKFAYQVNGIKLISTYRPRPGELSAVENPGPCHYNNGGCPFLCLGVSTVYRRCACPTNHPSCNDTVGPAPGVILPDLPSSILIGPPRPPVPTFSTFASTAMLATAPPNTKDAVALSQSVSTSISAPIENPNSRLQIQQHPLNIDIVVAVTVISLFLLIMLIVMFAVIIICMRRAQMKQERSLRRISINNTINKLDPRNATKARSAKPHVLNNTLPPSKQQTTIAATNPLGIRPLIPTQLPTGMRPLTPTISSAKVANSKGIQPLTLTPPVTLPLSKSKPKSIPPLTPSTKASKSSPLEPNVYIESPEVCELPAPMKKRRHRSGSGSVSPLKSVTFFGVADEIQPPPRPPRHSGTDDDAPGSPTDDGPSRPPKHGTGDAAGVPYPPGDKPPRPPKYSIGNFDEVSLPIGDEHPLISPRGVRVQVMRLEVEVEVEGRKEEESDRTRDSGLELMLATDSGGDSVSRGSSDSCADESSC